MSDNANRKQEFRKWLDENGVRNPAPALILQSMDEASEYAYKRKMISNSFWEIENSGVFNAVRAKLLGMRLFRLIHRNAASILDKSWKYYVSFLDYEVQRNSRISDAPQNELTSSSSSSDESVDMTSATEIRYDSVDEHHILHTDREFSDDLGETEQTTEFMIRKSVDKSLLRAGMTIPKAYADKLMELLGVDLQKGEKCSIAVLLEDVVYEAYLVSVNFSEKYEDVFMLQIRYSASSPLCNRLNDIFVDIGLDATEKANEDYIEVRVIDNKKLRFDCFKNTNVTDDQGFSIGKGNEPATESALVDVILLDISSVKNLAYTKVVSAKMFGEQGFGIQYWRDVFLFVLKMLYARKSEFFDKLRNRHNVRGVAFNFTDNPSELRYPLEITTGFYVEGNLSATDIGRRIKILLDIMAVPQSELEVYYTRNSISAESKDSKATSGDLIDFFTWLTEEEKMAPASCRGYVSSLKSISEYAGSTGILSSRLDEISDNDELKNAVEALNDNPDYRDYNAQQHNRFSAAINKYLMFKGLEAAPRQMQSRVGSDVIPTTVVAAEPAEIQSGYRDGVEQLLKSRFKYGFRLTSDMDIMRMRQFAEMAEIELPENDDTLKMLIAVVGFKVEDKVFVISDETIDFLKSVVEKYAGAGTQVFFYDALMVKEYDELMENQISSEDMLKELLMKHCPGYTFSKNFMAVGPKQTEMEAVVSEVKRVWGEGLLRTFEELDEMLPMVPLDKIKYMLSYSDLFVWNSQETYAYVGNVVISDEEADAIAGFVRSKCEINGFASLSDVPLGAIAEVNYELSNTALYAAIYNRVLHKKFTLNGKILTFPGKSLSAVFLVKTFCADKDECTFDELHEKVIELTGGTNRQIAFEAGYDTMIRIRQNRFVADRFVEFDVAAIDSLLDEIIDGDFTAIRGIATFAAFPVCGQVWNHYLLESYCHRYSKKYRLSVMNYNDKNAGIIVKKSSRLKYKDMLAIVASKADVPLTVESVGAYLCSAGYLAKSKYAGLGDIVDQAKVLREENH